MTVIVMEFALRQIHALKMVKTMLTLTVYVFDSIVVLWMVRMTLMATAFVGMSMLVQWIVKMILTTTDYVGTLTFVHMTQEMTGMEIVFVSKMIRALTILQMMQIVIQYAET